MIKRIKFIWRDPEGNEEETTNLIFTADEVYIYYKHNKADEFTYCYVEGLFSECLPHAHPGLCFRCCLKAHAYFLKYLINPITLKREPFIISPLRRISKEEAQKIMDNMEYAERIEEELDPQTYEIDPKQGIRE
jgi:hypothetical protein